MSNEYQVGVYYFPNYHIDARNEAAHGRGWTEWELVKRAEPRFPGHRQPRKPLWGYEDESDPSVMERKIRVASEHGIDSFIFDWYWYNDGPFLNRCMDEGFLGARNCSELKFSLMWANHTWYDIHPAKYGQEPALQYPGEVTRETFDTVAEYIVENYFTRENYWKIDGRPYFSIYELMTLVRGLGGMEAAKDALASLRQRAREAGLPDLHLNAVVWGVQILPGEEAIKNPNEMLSYLGFDSVTSYVWIHHMPLPKEMEVPYESVLEHSVGYWRTASEEYLLPYYPNVTMGWDASPRTVQTDSYELRGYPFMQTLSGNTPVAFEQALARTKEFLDGRGKDKVFTINAWNEWTEGSYLEPDTDYAMGYLEAIKRVFGR